MVKHVVFSPIQQVTSQSGTTVIQAKPLLFNYLAKYGRVISRVGVGGTPGGAFQLYQVPQGKTLFLFNVEFSFSTTSAVATQSQQFIYVDQDAQNNDTYVALMPFSVSNSIRDYYYEKNFPYGYRINSGQIIWYRYYVFAGAPNQNCLITGYEIDNSILSELE